MQNWIVRIAVPAIIFVWGSSHWTQGNGNLLAVYGSLSQGLCRPSVSALSNAAARVRNTGWEQGSVYIYIDNSRPSQGPCGARRVYLRNTTGAARTVTVTVTKPPAINRCTPRETESRSITVSAGDEVFLGLNQVNCSGSVTSVQCGEVSYRL